MVFEYCFDKIRHMATWDLIWKHGEMDIVNVLLLINNGLTLEVYMKDHIYF